MQEVALQNRSTVWRRHEPTREMTQHAGIPHDIAGGQVGTIDEWCHRSAGEEHRSAHHDACRMEEDDEVLLGERFHGPAGDFSKQNERDPCAGRGHVATGHQTKINGSRHHDEAAEKYACNGGPSEAVFEIGRRFKKCAVALQLRIDRWF